MFTMRAAVAAVGANKADKIKVFAHDIGMAGASVVVALYLRLGQEAFTTYLPLTLKAVVAFIITAGFMFLAFGMYRGVWRYASIGDVATLAKAVSLAILVYMALMFFMDPESLLPRSVPIIQWFVLAVMVGAPRLSYRMLLSREAVRWLPRGRGTRARRQGRPERPAPVLLVGVCDRAALFVRAMENATTAAYEPVGIVDVTTASLGRSVRGVPVLGTIEDLPALIERLSARGQRPQKIILAADDDALQGARLRFMADLAQGAEISLVRLGDFTETPTASDEGHVDLRPIALEDLLGRPQVTLDRAAIGGLVAQRRVLITGAGGSIGSELAQQIAALAPACLILADSSEFNLYSIDLKVAAARPDLARNAVLLDVRDRERVERVFAKHRPELVFHVAALKHVPMVESHPCEGVLTNVVGTRNVADAAARCGALAAVLISTDKAVSPSSAMGATKRLAEFYCQAADLQGRDVAPFAGSTRFITVRFGNVLGSSGSVVPLFQQQIASGGPLTITHPDIERYFMTIREAVELVLQASAHGMAHADERGRIYVLDMGEPIRIADIARHLIRLHGKKPDIDVKLEFVGLRPGEKLREELFDVNESRRPAATTGVLAAISQPPQLSFLREVYQALEKAARDGDEAVLQRLINLVLPDYRLSGSTAAAPLSAPGAEETAARPLDGRAAKARQPAIDLRAASLGAFQVSLQRDHSS